MKKIILLAVLACAASVSASVLHGDNAAALAMQYLLAGGGDTGKAAVRKMRGEPEPTFVPQARPIYHKYRKCQKCMGSGVIRGKAQKGKLEAERKTCDVCCGTGKYVIGYEKPETVSTKTAEVQTVKIQTAPKSDEWIDQRDEKPVDAAKLDEKPVDAANIKEEQIKLFREGLQDSGLTKMQIERKVAAYKKTLTK